jgi:hypothetical protein
VAVILTGKGRWMSPDAKTLGRVEQTLAASLRDVGSVLVGFRLVATGHALEGVQTQLRAVASRGRHGLTMHISAQTACDFGLIRPPVSGQFAQRFRRFRHPFRSNPPQLWVEGRGV